MYPANSDKSISPAPYKSFARIFAGTLFTLLSVVGTFLFAESPRAIWEAPAENPLTVDQGHLSVRWAVEGDTAEHSFRFQLQQSFDGSFEDQRIAYEGPDRGTFVSGLPPEGAHLRVRASAGDDGAWGPWSETLEVAVDYPSERQVALFGALGGIMFFVLVITISRGALLRGSTPQS
jgi:hypothetical protein